MKTGHRQTCFNHSVPKCDKKWRLNARLPDQSRARWVNAEDFTKGRPGVDVRRHMLQFELLLYICHMSGWSCSHSSPHNTARLPTSGVMRRTRTDQHAKRDWTRFHLGENTFSFLKLTERVVWRMPHSRRFAPGLFSWASPLQKENKKKMAQRVMQSCAQVPSLQALNFPEKKNNQVGH